MRPPLRSARISSQPCETSRFSFALLLCLAVIIQPLDSQAPPSQPTGPQTTTPQEKPMKHYALLFHTNSNRPLTPKEQERRRVEIAAWAKQVTDMGIKLDPRALGEDSSEPLCRRRENCFPRWVKRSSVPQLRLLRFRKQRPGREYCSDTSGSALRLHRRGTRMDRPSAGRGQTLIGSGPENRSLIMHTTNLERFS
jgi:hypothetical protein